MSTTRAVRDRGGLPTSSTAMNVNRLLLRAQAI
jgi:hypothetical protein